jgi:hypothetical protein
MPDQASPRTGRRAFFKAALVPALAVAVGELLGRGRAEAQAPLPDSLPRRLVVGKPDIPPLDSPIVFAREGTNNKGGTVEVLSLIQEEKGDTSFPWTLFAQLRSRHTTGDAVVLQARLYKDGPGWSAGVHSEVFSRNWGVGIGVNIEMSNQYEGTQGFNGIIGIEMQSLGPKRALAGLQIEGGGGFETQVRLRGAADTGIDIPGKCGVGVNLRGNALRMDEGTWVQLDQAGRIRLRYLNGNIEFYNGNRRIAYLPVSSEDHKL